MHKGYSKWKPSRINQIVEMVRCDFENNWIETRSLKWWEVILYFREVKEIEKVRLL